MRVTATELKNRLGRYLDAAAREPVIVEKSGRDFVVMVAYADYERLEALEDAYWGERALAAEKNGEFLEGAAALEALEALAKQKSVSLDAPTQ
jgi:prevent-host-death family protein